MNPISVPIQCGIRCRQINAGTFSWWIYALFHSHFLFCVNIIGHRWTVHTFRIKRRRRKQRCPLRKIDLNACVRCTYRFMCARSRTRLAIFAVCINQNSKRVRFLHQMHLNCNINNNVMGATQQNTVTVLICPPCYCAYYAAAAANCAVHSTRHS